MVNRNRCFRSDLRRMFWLVLVSALSLNCKDIIAGTNQPESVLEEFSDFDVIDLNGVITSKLDDLGDGNIEEVCESTHEQRFTIGKRTLGMLRSDGDWTVFTGIRSLGAGTDQAARKSCFEDVIKNIYSPGGLEHLMCAGPHAVLVFDTDSMSKKWSYRFPDNAWQYGKVVENCFSDLAGKRWGVTTSDPADGVQSYIFDSKGSLQGRYPGMAGISEDGNCLGIARSISDRTIEVRLFRNGNWNSKIFDIGPSMIPALVVGGKVEIGAFDQGNGQSIVYLEWRSNHEVRPNTKLWKNGRWQYDLACVVSLNASLDPIDTRTKQHFGLLRKSLFGSRASIASGDKMRFFVRER